MPHKTLHRKLQIEQQEHHWKQGINTVQFFLKFFFRISECLFWNRGTICCNHSVYFVYYVFLHSFDQNSFPYKYYFI
jgi:hypothetical protein